MTRKFTYLKTMKTAYIYNIFQRWAFLAAVLLLIVMSFLSTTIPFGGQMVADVNAKYHTLVSPAGYAYIIWGIIYLFMGVFAVFQLNKGKNIRFFRLVFPYFLVTVISNILWLFAFQHEFIGLAALFILITLGALIMIFQKFYRLKHMLSTTHRYFFQMPFSLYFGWITITTIVNIAIFLQTLNITAIEGSGEVIAIIVLIGAALLGLYILITKKDYIYASAMVWGFIAIWIGQLDVTSVMNTAKFAAIGILAAMAIKITADRIKVAQYGRPAST